MERDCAKKARNANLHRFFLLTLAAFIANGRGFFDGLYRDGEVKDLSGLCVLY